MSWKRAFLLIIGLALLGGCRGSPEGERIGSEGAILYKPQRDDSLRPETRTKAFVFSYVIVDDRTGYRLRPLSPVTLAGRQEIFSQWMLDRSSRKQPAIHFLTRSRDPRELGLVPWARVTEIVHAHVDGFFPFEDALYQQDLRFERIAGMLDIQGMDEGRRGHHYLDNRLAYKREHGEWARLRRASPFRPANFEPDLMSTPGAKIYFPAAGSVKYDPATKTAIARDGSRLHSDNRRWNIFLDRSGVKDRIYATWSDAAGQSRNIVMRPWRGHRDGYGETRAVEIISEAGAARDPGTPVPDGPPWPSGEALAELINMSVPIAGEHAGHLVVVDNRAYRGEWR